MTATTGARCRAIGSNYFEGSMNLMMIDAHNLSMGCFPILFLFTYGGPDITVSWEVKSMFTILYFSMCVCVY